MEASDEEVVEAARAAEIHEFVAALHQGYATRVGEVGGRLSGGQWQRLALVRAPLRDPAVLILDEATWALAPATEAAVTANAGAPGSRPHHVSVTHRLTSVVDKHRIFVIDVGRLVAEVGTGELLNRKGL